MAIPPSIHAFWSAFTSGNDEASKTGDQKSEPRYLPPLPRRDPTKAAAEYDNQREIRWVEHMLVVPSDEELAGDCNERG
jgi:hypothetical protein